MSGYDFVKCLALMIVPASLYSCAIVALLYWMIFRKEDEETWLD